MNYLNSFFFFTVFWIGHIVVLLLQGLLFLKFIPVHKNKKNRILYLENLPFENAGYQYRAYKWASILKGEGHVVDLATIIAEKKKFEYFLKNNYTRFLAYSLFKRIYHIIKSRKYGTVIVRREVLMYNEYGNLFLEKLLLKIHPDAILDFDDNKRLLHYSNSLSWYGRLMLEERDKFYKSLQLYRRFIVSTNYLKELVLSQNKPRPEIECIVIPTCVDYQHEKPKEYGKKPSEFVIGWIGSNGNQRYLDTIVKELNQLHQTHKFKLLVVSGKAYKNETAKFPIENKSWTLKNEKNLIKTMDIGIMPLDFGEVQKAKGGFKLIQYMGLGVVCVGTGITVNNEIIDHGQNGYLIRKNQTWKAVLSIALDNYGNFSKIGSEARKKVLKNYTFEANTQKYIEFIIK